MSPLKAKFIRDLAIRGKAKRTQESYCEAVTNLSQFYGRSPAMVSYEEVVDWLYHRFEVEGIAASSNNIAVSALRFLYATTLKRDVRELMAAVPRMKRPVPRAEVYACSEVAAILKATCQPRDFAFLAIVYGCGLRLSEATQLKVTDIDRGRMQLRVRHGKGGKERVLPLSDACYQVLRDYWREQRAGKRGADLPWLFLGSRLDGPMSRSTGQGIYYRAVLRSKVRRKSGIHVLRHSFATHCIENGVPLARVQRYLGHTSLATTARYLHVTTVRSGPVGSALDLIDTARTVAPELL